MSLNAMTASASAILSSTNFRSHGHRKGAHPDANTGTDTSSIGQLPVGASNALFSGLVQSFQQSLGAAAAGAGGGVASATGAASTTSSAASPINAPASGAVGAGALLTPAQRQEMQAFQHSLIQALKQDGMSSSAPGTLSSSLQSLIQQLSPDGKATAATSTLTATFQNLMNGVGGTGAAASAAAGGTGSQASNSSLQNFLSNLLQNLQANGVSSLSSTGGNVNTHV